MTSNKTLPSSGARESGSDAHTSASSSGAACSGSAGRTARIRVDELLSGAREAILIHRGQEYRLRITSSGKLILTK
jgi:hemin uptake protein HemP